MKKLNLIGVRFGRLVVVDDITIKGKRSNFLCLCDCGKTKTVYIDKLRGGDTKSCGCLNSELTSLRASNMRKPNEQFYHEPIIASARAIYKLYSDGLTFEQFYDLSSKNCFYCNKAPSNSFNCYDKTATKERRDKAWFIYSGLDRIDSSLSHNIDNVVPCCWECNYSKSNYSQKEFYDFIIKLTSHQEALTKVVS